jgi:hypothetical protein
MMKLTPQILRAAALGCLAMSALGLSNCGSPSPSTQSPAPTPPLSLSATTPSETAQPTAALAVTGALNIQMSREFGCDDKRDPHLVATVAGERYSFGFIEPGTDLRNTSPATFALGPGTAAATWALQFIHFLGVGTVDVWEAAPGGPYGGGTVSFGQGGRSGSVDAEMWKFNRDLGHDLNNPATNIHIHGLWTCSASQTGATLPSATGAAAAPGSFSPSPPLSSDGSKLAAAVAIVKSKGYDVIDTTTYQPGPTLGVLVGSATGSADGYNKSAFFFVAGRYIGTDAVQPSANVKVVWQDDSTVALSYDLYHSGDPLCCPTGGAATVRFHWNGQVLTPLDPIPSQEARL